ncbi:MAG TPA: very short patch repair endonuclease [Dehalococcoidia bacterium]|nr:very short patch repair endonuclease [Dehalococcoidia bacterium]
MAEPPKPKPSSPERSRIMRSVPRRDTTPERALRSALHAAGLRFRLHRGSLPGSPDIVFPAAKLVVFVHGCFWHRHEGCRRATFPKTNQDYWTQKFAANRERDARKVQQLTELGWRVMVVWQCQIDEDVAGVVRAICEAL